MLAVIAGTNRPESNTLRIAALVREILVEHGEEVTLLDVAKLPPGVFSGSAYREKPPGFQPFQDAILAASGILTVVPEYNGSFPGILKYFIDMLRFPESLHEKPSAFVGISSGRWGAVRAVEHLEMVFQFRHAHLFGRRVFIPDVRAALDDAGGLADPELDRRLRAMVLGFSDFCRRLRGGAEIGA